jgi:RNA polymerase sigma factor (sigma-70 family)
VFTTLFEKLDDIEDPERLQAWLVTTTRRRTLRTISQMPATLRLDDAADDLARTAEMLRDESPLPDEQLLVLEEQHRIRTAVAQLDERCQTLVRLLFYQSEPPSYAEVAEVLGVPEGSIGPTRARCLGKLLRILTKVDPMYFLLVSTLC